LGLKNAKVNQFFIDANPRLEFPTGRNTHTKNAKGIVFVGYDNCVLTTDGIVIHGIQSPTPIKTRHVLRGTVIRATCPAKLIHRSLREV
jgi:hypothetical protein